MWFLHAFGRQGAEKRGRPNVFLRFGGAAWPAGALPECAFGGGLETFIFLAFFGPGGLRRRQLLRREEAKGSPRAPSRPGPVGSLKKVCVFRWFYCTFRRGAECKYAGGRRAQAEGPCGRPNLFSAGKSLCSLFYDRGHRKPVCSSWFLFFCW